MKKREFVVHFQRHLRIKLFCMIIFYFIFLSYFLINYVNTAVGKMEKNTSHTAGMKYCELQLKKRAMVWFGGLLIRRLSYTLHAYQRRGRAEGFLHKT